MPRMIHVLVSPRGETTVQTKGYCGGACREASTFIEQALGQRTSETMTAEFHADQRAGQEIQQSQ